MGSFGSRSFRVAAALMLAFGAAAASPIACFPSDYVFDLPNGAGASSASSAGSMSTTTSGGGHTTVSSTTGMGASTTTGTPTSATSTVSSSTGGPPCATADCSDPTCKTSFSCVPSTTAPTFPAGFTGYFALFDGMASNFNQCETLFPNSMYTGNNQIMVQPAQCNCSCGAPSGEKCEINGPVDTTMPMSPPILPGAIDAIFAQDAPCNGSSLCAGPLLEVPTWTGTCDGPNYYPANTNTCQPAAGQDCSMGSAACNQSVTVNALVVTPGSCTPNAQAPTIPPVGWGTLGAACGGATPGTGCTDTNDVCMPVPPGPFHSGLCIMQTGDVSCSGQFSEKHLFYGGADDTRMCTTCGCDPSSGGSCSATITVYGNTGGGVCQAAQAIATLKPSTSTGDCKDLTGNPAVGSKKATFSAVTPGSCNANAMPMGTATPNTPTTFCCIP